MLLDKWKVNKSNTLFRQIEELKGQIPNKTFEAITAVRKIGNIGAHMKNPNINTIDNSIITSTDAKALISLLEVLFKSWYIDPHQEEELMDTLISTSEDMKKKEV